MTQNAKKTSNPNIVSKGSKCRVWLIFLPLRSLDFELFGVILYMHINLLFACALLFFGRAGAGFGGKHENI